MDLRPTRLLRSPRVVIFAISAICTLCILGAIIPQQGAGSDLPAASGDTSTWILSMLGLDHVFSSWIFIVVIALSFSSLLLTVIDQVRHLTRGWLRVPAPDAFSTAPYRHQWTRGRGSTTDQVGVSIVTRGRAGLFGSPLLHLGLLIVIVGAGLSALFGVDGVVQAYELETLPAGSESWARQWPGPLASPLALGVPVMLREVRWARYKTGRLRKLEVDLMVGQPGNRERKCVAVNKDLSLPGGRLFLADKFGVAALVQLTGQGAPDSREAALLTEVKTHRYEGIIETDRGTLLHLRAETGPAGERPEVLEVRATRNGALLGARVLARGQAMDVPGEGRIELHQLLYWVTLRGSRDPGRWVAYIGFAFVLAGAFLLFAVIKVDSCVTVEPISDKEERVCVAMRPARFPALFRESFERSVKANGGVVNDEN